MSHFREETTAMKNQQALIRGLCIQTGLKASDFEVHDQPVTITDYYGGVKRANIVLRRNKSGIPSDIGWLKNKDGTYTAMVDEFDYSSWGNSRGCTVYDKKWQGKLLYNYNIEVAKLALEAKGQAYIIQTLPDGRHLLRSKFTAPKTGSRMITHN